MLDRHYQEMSLPAEVKELLAHGRGYIVPRDRQTLLDLAMGGDETADVYEVSLRCRGPRPRGRKPP